MPSTPRSLKDALNNAERIRKELPSLIQPSSTDYDMVTLQAHVAELESALEFYGCRNPEGNCKDHPQWAKNRAMWCRVCLALNPE